VSEAAERVARLVALARAQEHPPDVLLFYTPIDVRYLTGFTGSHGLALIDVEGRLGGHRFLTDFRYETQSSQQVPGDLFACQAIDDGKLLDASAAILKARGPAGRLGIDEARVTVAQHSRLRELLPERWELACCGGLIEKLRAVKEPGEVRRIRAAAELADEALRRSVLQRGLAGRTEREVAIELELAMRRLGAEPSFPTIVASGAHGALPHAEARDEPIGRDALVTIDWGALLDGYCSDCTRTYATGKRLPARAREVYELVLSAQRAALAALRAGPSGVQLDAVAREIIESAGLGERFGHGLGHGVGMEVHEGPRLSRAAGEDPIVAGNVVTVEPGVYLPGELGVRIEDLAVVRSDGHELLTGLPTELTVVG
jgi:Xaa-Pro aminopeptidase